MPKFIAICYGDRAGYDRTPEQVKENAHEQDARLVRQGALIGRADPPIQIRNPDAKGVETDKGPYMTSKLPVAGFTIIETADMDEAIEKLSRVPCAVAHGVVEVWPLREQIQDQM
ncbi:MAG: transcription initiation protein [Rhizobiaceae bacterium]|nr:transcription initiation protein [Rhizobiaceae bacterium]